MRLRNIPGSREAIASSPYVVPEYTLGDQRGRWNELFGNNRPIHIEIGMGKGRFITQMAEAHPNINYLGIEKYSSVLIRALQKRESQPELTNLYFLRMDAEELPNVFAPGEVGRIYLNFSDPWPKDRHAKRRLPSREFLQRYDQILAPRGRIEFKTDNHSLFQFALNELSESGWQMDYCTYDLHNDPILSRDNVMTEYEERFSAEGNPIHKVVFFHPDHAAGSQPG